MRGVLQLVRIGMRARIRAAVLLAVVLGVAGGACLLTLAGARRTHSAVDRFVAYAEPSDAYAQADPATYPQLARLPEVRDSFEAAFLALVPRAVDGRPPADTNLNTFGIVSGGGVHGLLVRGRFFDLASDDEVIVNPTAAAREHLSIGSTIDLRAVRPEDAAEFLSGPGPEPRGPEVTVHVVGIVRQPQDLSVAPSVPGVVYQGQSNVLFPPGFFARYGAQIATAGGVGFGAVLRHGQADFAAFHDDVRRIAGPDAFSAYGSDDLTAAALAKHATDIAALALLVFGALAAVLTLAMVGQALSRQAQTDAADLPTLSALGVTSTQLVAASVLRAAVVAVAGCALAASAAYAGSGTMPIGIARDAEISPGRSFDPTVLLGGACVIAIACVLWSWLAARRAVRRAHGAPTHPAAARARRSPLAEVVGRAGASPSATVGVRMALEPGREVPTRTTLAGAALAVAAVVATTCFGVNLTRLATRPALQGWSWDVAVGNPHDGDTSATTPRTLSADPDVTGATSIAGPGPGHVDGHPEVLPVVALERLTGNVYPPLSRGRAPATADEVALGALTRRQLHLDVGQSVTITGDRATHTFTVTGEIVLSPAVVNDQMPLGHAVVVTPAGMAALGDGDRGSYPTNVFLVSLRPGADRAAAIARLQHSFPGTVLTPVRPPDIENLRRVDGLPPLLAGLFAAIALLTVGHTLIGSVRRRRGDLAVLRTMGFVRRQVSAAVAWQASTVGLVALAIGAPIGVIAGRWTSVLVTHQLGLPARAIIPWSAALVAPTVLILLNALALIPGRLASRARPSAVLRAE